MLLFLDRACCFLYCFTIVSPLLISVFSLHLIVIQKRKPIQRTLGEVEGVILLQARAFTLVLKRMCFLWHCSPQVECFLFLKPQNRPTTKSANHFVSAPRVCPTVGETGIPRRTRSVVSVFLERGKVARIWRLELVLKGVSFSGEGAQGSNYRWNGE